MAGPNVPKLSVLALVSSLSPARYTCCAGVVHDSYLTQDLSVFRQEAENFFVFYNKSYGNLKPKGGFLDATVADLRTSLVTLQALCGLSDVQMSTLVGRAISWRTENPKPTYYAMTSWTHDGADHVSDLFCLRMACVHPTVSDGAACSMILIYMTQLLVCCRLSTYKEPRKAYQFYVEIPS